MAKILIVDDSNFFRQIYVKTLTDAGYTVEEAINGSDAIDKMVASPPDLVFLDLVMPVMTGEEVLAEMKKNDATKSIPVVMLTSISADVKGADLLTVGSLAGYMTKDTATPQDILNKTHELLEVTSQDVYPDKTAAAATPVTPEQQPMVAAPVPAPDPAPVQPVTQMPPQPIQPPADPAAGAAPMSTDQQPPEQPFDPTSMGQAL